MPQDTKRRTSMWVALYKSGFSLADIAGEFHVSRQFVQKCIRNHHSEKLELEHKIALAHRQHEEKAPDGEI